MSSKSYQSVAIFHILPALIYIQKTIRLKILHIVPFNLTCRQRWRKSCIPNSAKSYRSLLTANRIPLTILFGREENASRFVVLSVAEVTLKAFTPTSLSWGLPYIIVQQHALAWVGLNRAWASHRECARRVPVGSSDHLPSILASSLFHTFRILIKVVLTIGSKTQTNCLAAALTGAHWGSGRPVRLIKIICPMVGNVPFIGVIKTKHINMFIIVSYPLISSELRPAPSPPPHYPSTVALHAITWSSLPAAGGREGMESG